MTTTTLRALPDYTSRGARALVLLHADALRDFVSVWVRAHDAGLALPASDDPSYASLQTLLSHVLRAARGYMVWTCEQVGLPEAGLVEVPEPEALAPGAALDALVDELLAGWERPLAAVGDDVIDGNDVFTSRWGVAYCIDAMLEHAVMHPIRHAFQLRELLGESGTR